MKKVSITGESLIDIAAAYTKINEGFSSTYYIDTTGNKTIGYGFNLAIYPSLSEPLSIEDADNLLKSIINENILYAKDIFDDPYHVNFFGNLEYNIQAVILDMIYNLGFKQFRDFINFIYYIRNDIDNYMSAGIDLEHTLWYEQVGIRGKRAVFNLFHPSWAEIYI